MLQKVVFITLFQSSVFVLPNVLVKAATLNLTREEFSNTPVFLDNLDKKNSITHKNDLLPAWSSNFKITQAPTLKLITNHFSNSEIAAFFQLTKALEISALSEEELILESNTISIQFQTKTLSIPTSNQYQSYQLPQFKPPSSSRLKIKKGLGTRG